MYLQKFLGGEFLTCAGPLGSAASHPRDLAHRKNCATIRPATHLCREVPVMSIAIESSNELEQLRTRLRKMTDAQLVSFGKA
jgi:hypothetical protein